MIHAHKNIPLTTNTGNNIYIIILLKSVCLSVAVHRLYATIAAQSSREVSQTVHNECNPFLSHVRILVLPSKFFIGKKKTERKKRVFG